ncbi:MAG: hypothetical protein K0S42_121 [Microvirga sp.]|jgi:hypothetical protein|nr:hypothetical protein [Microvirga sp.]
MDTARSAHDIALDAACSEAERRGYSRELAAEIVVTYSDALLDSIGWQEIDAYHLALRKGQDVYEDGGGFFARTIGALLGRPAPDPVLPYREAARALLAAREGIGR